MHSMTRAGLLGLMLIVPAYASDPLEEVKARRKIEAERVEREFTELRASAYRLVRADSPRLSAALDQLDSIERLLRDDTSLSAEKKGLFERTLKNDLLRVREIAEKSRRVAERPPVRPSYTPSRPSVDGGSSSGSTLGKDKVSGFGKVFDDRKKMLASSTKYKKDAADGRLKMGESIYDSATPQTDTYKFPPPEKWKEISEKRSTKYKMTAKERAIMEGLEKSHKVDFEKMNFQDALDYMRKVTGLPITVDRKALEKLGHTYDTPVTLKTEASARTLIKRLAGDLDMAYLIKDESIHLTSREIASRTTLTKTYYLGDLVGIVDARLDPITSQLIMQERVNGLLTMITSKVDPNSWNVNNPDAVGKIAFYGPTLSLIVTQTAEFHMKYFSK